MNRPEREAAVRRLMETVPVSVPPELPGEAVRRGARLLRLRRRARRLLWLVLGAAAMAFVTWAALTRPWVEPPSSTTPPLSGW
ncbi:hypothetical protein ACFWN1_16290 [Streptomyces sp. NPDC058459]|uniref:hypothetical protein n=1 Tax=Streptomyces sp. NPDC058459 TaxID=3346508 RepID=UPI00364E0C16